MLFATVGLFNCDVKIAAAAGWVHIGNLKCARRNIALINGVTILFDNYLRVSTGDAAHHRRVATQAIGQHIIVGGQLCAAERHTIKQLGGRGAVAEC